MWHSGIPARICRRAFIRSLTCGFVGTGLIVMTLGVMPPAGAQTFFPAVKSAPASDGPGTNIGDAAQLTPSGSGSMTSATSDDWWVIYPAAPGGTVAVTVHNTTSASAACNGLTASLDASNGTSDVLTGATLGPGASQQISGHSTASDRYFVEVDVDDCDPASGQPVTYALTLNQGGGGTAPAPAAGSIKAGSSIGSAWPPLQGKTSYTGTIAGESADDWYVLYKKPDANPGTIRVEDTTDAGSVGCASVVVSLDAADGTSDVISGADLSDNSADTITVPGQSGSDPSGLYYLEVSSPNCPDGGISYRIEPEPADEWQNPAQLPSGTAAPGSSIGAAWPPLQGATTYDGTITGSTDENWYVLYLKPGTSAASVRVEDTTIAGSTSCPGVVANLDAADGGDDVLTGANLSDNGASTLAIPDPGGPDYLGRYDLEVQSNGCPSGGATYRIEPEPGGVWASPAKPSSQGLPAGTDKKKAGGPLSGGVKYDTDLPDETTQRWSFFVGTGKTPLTVSVQNTTSYQDNCQDESFTLLTTGGVVTGANLSDDDEAELVVDTGQTFYLEVSDSDDCPPDMPLTATVTLTPTKAVRTCCACGSASARRPAPDQAGSLVITAQTYRQPSTPTETITNKTFPVMVGEKVTLTAECQNPAGTSLAPVTWAIPGTTASPATVVASYGDAKGDLTGGGPVPLTDLKKNPITFYIASASAKPLVIKSDAKLGGKPVPATTTLHVYTPSLAKRTARTCRVDVNNHITDKPIVRAGLYLGFNDTCRMTPGISWKLKADTPAFSEDHYAGTDITGELAMSQIINITATGTLKNASKPQTWSTRGRWCSDTWPLYHQGTSLPLSANTTVSVSTGDGNPGWESLDVPGLGDLKDRTTGSVSGKFRDFVLYRPANGIWIPLGGYTWAFSGSATISARGQASLDSKPAPTWPGSPKKTADDLPFLSRATLAHASGDWWPVWPGIFNAAGHPACSA
jgi:hypothetical protein